MSTRSTRSTRSSAASPSVASSSSSSQHRGLVGRALTPVALWPLMKKAPARLKPFITNGKCKIYQKYENTLFGSIHDFPNVIRIAIPIGTIFIDGNRVDIKDFDAEKLKGQYIYFDAVSHLSLKHRYPALGLPLVLYETYEVFVAALSWQGARPLPQDLLPQDPLLVDPVSLDGNRFFQNVSYRAIVVVVQPGHCVVKVNGVPVYVDPSVLVVDPWTRNPVDTLISPMDYLEVGEEVAITMSWNGSCYVADKLGNGSRFRLSSNSEAMTGLPTFRKYVTEEEALSELLPRIECPEDFYLNPGSAFEGVVVEIPFRNYAIAVIGVIRVLISVDAIPPQIGVRDIARYLQVGSAVLLYVRGTCIEFGFLCTRFYYQAGDARLNSKRVSIGIHNISADIARTENTYFSMLFFENKECQIVWSPLELLHGPEMLRDIIINEPILILETMYTALRTLPSAKLTFSLGDNGIVLKSVWIVPPAQPS